MFFLFFILCFCTTQSKSSSETYYTLIKRKSNFPHIHRRKFRMEPLQMYIWLTVSSYMGKYLGISSHISKPFLIYSFGTAPLWISLYMRKIRFSFLSVYLPASLSLSGLNIKTEVVLQLLLFIINCCWCSCCLSLTVVGAAVVYH